MPCYGVLLNSVFARLFLSSFPVCSLADAVPRTKIEGRIEYPKGVTTKAFDIEAKITLDHGAYTTYAQTDGSFVIHGVGPGIHKLDIDSKNYHFPHIKIQLLEGSMDSPNCLEYDHPGASKRALNYPLVINPKGTYQYFEAKKGFSLFALLRNPMVLMMLFSVGIMVAMPYMMDGLDPEEKARMREQMKNQQDPSAMLSQMWGDMTGANQDEAPKTKKERRRVKQN